MKQRGAYKRCGMANIFLACEPLAGKRMINVTERRTALDWAGFIEEIAVQYEQAEKITLVMDNLNTHKAGSFYLVGGQGVEKTASFRVRMNRAP